MRALLALVAIATTGCRSLECAEGTFEDGDTCVGFDPNDLEPPITTASPAGGRSREPIPKLVTLTTNEPAKIYFTIDGTDPDPAALPGEPTPAAVVGIEQGTTLKYFAIDRAGNRGEIVTTIFDSDTAPPSPVSNLAISLAGTTANLSWANPTDADFAGTIIARVADAIDVAPTPGMLYTAPSPLSSSVQIVNVGKTTTFSDPSRPAGPVRYVAWTYDDLGNYSIPHAVKDAIPLGSLVAQFTYSAANGLATTMMPANLDLAGTTAALNGTTLTLSLSVKNTSAQYFQNMKAEVTSTTNVTFGNSDGTADGFPFKSLGPNLVAPNATVTRTLTFNNLAAGNTATINITFAHHPSLVAMAGQSLQRLHLVDLGSSQTTPILDIKSRGPNDRSNGRLRPPVLVGGRYLDIPSTHGIERWDLLNRQFVKATKLSDDDSQRVVIQSLYPTPNATFAVIKRGGKRRVAAAELLRLDEALDVTGKLALPNDDIGFTRAAFSPDFSLMAIPVEAGVALVDTRTMTLVDASPATTGTVDLFEPGFTDEIRAAVFFDGANGLLVLARRGGKAAIIRRTADDYTVTAYQDAAASAQGQAAVKAADGRIWMAFGSPGGLRVFNPATGAVSNVTYTQPIHGLANLDGTLWVIRNDRVNLDQISNTGAVQRTITLPAGQGASGHWIELSR